MRSARYVERAIGVVDGSDSERRCALDSREISRITGSVRAS